MTKTDAKTLRHCLRLLGRMVEREPSIVALKSWQMASEGIATMAKIAELEFGVRIFEQTFKPKPNKRLTAQKKADERRDDGKQKR